MNFVDMITQITAIYKDIEINEVEDIQKEESQIIEIGIQQNIMKNRLMYTQIRLLIKLLLTDMDNIKDFNSITDERRNEIIDRANFLKDAYSFDARGNDYFFKFLIDQIYSVKRSNLYINKLNLNLLNRKEKIALIIEAIDPNFEMYKFYLNVHKFYKEENGNQEILEEEKIIFNTIENEYGKITKKLIIMEKLYIQRFGMNEEISLSKK